MLSSNNNSSNNKNPGSSPINEATAPHLFSTEKWGVTSVRQDTPWALPPSPTSNPSSATPSLSSSTTIANAGVSALHSNRFDQAWRAPAAVTANAKPHQASMASASPFANHNLINPVQGVMQKSLGAGAGNGGMQHGGGEFARAPGQASSLMDNNMTPKPFGMNQRASTWAAFGNPVAPNDTEPEWPKTTTSGISANQSTNAFDLMPEFEPGKSWHGSMLMKSLDEDAGSLEFGGPASVMSNFGAGSYVGGAPKSPTGSLYEASGIGTWSPVVKSGRSGAKWDSDGPEGSDNGRFDDGTAIWGSPAPGKSGGMDWDRTTGDANSNNDKSRTLAGDNQSYRPQQSSSSASLLMSQNTSPLSQQNRNQQTLKQTTHNFDQVQQQANALSSQSNKSNRGLGLSSSKVPSTQQLKHMVQQIQLAVQAGHLNPQILNQPLAPATLQLLYQLLQQIKYLQQLQMQASQQFNKPGNHPATVNVHITKTKQNILNLQNQIAAQQAVYIKSTQAHNISTRQSSMPGLANNAMGSGMGPALPPGISQSGDSFRSGMSVGDFHHGQTMVNSFADGLANSFGHMNLGAGASALHSNRFDQAWRAPAAVTANAKPHQASMASASPFANHNLINPVQGVMQKSLGAGAGNGGMQHGGGEFARAPGQASSLMDNNMTPKPFGMGVRSTASTWSAFGAPAHDEPESEWPKTTTSSTTSGISAGNSTQSTNAFDLVPEFEPGKPWRGSMLMKSVEDDPTMTPGSMARSLAPQRKTIWSDEIL